MLQQKREAMYINYKGNFEVRSFVTIHAVEKQYVLHNLSLFCSLSYPACNRMPHIVICGLSGSALFSTSHKVHDF
jgi:hypothetical protein